MVYVSFLWLMLSVVHRYVVVCKIFVGMSDVRMMLRMMPVMVMFGVELCGMKTCKMCKLVA